VAACDEGPTVEAERSICWSNGLGPFILMHQKNLKPTINARESMLDSIPGIEEDLNRLKRWTSCTPLVKPVRGGR
jgi:hypothetical protein